MRTLLTELSLLGDYFRQVRAGWFQSDFWLWPFVILAVAGPPILVVIILVAVFKRIF